MRLGQGPRWLAAVLVLVLPVVACGDDDEDETTATGATEDGGTGEEAAGGIEAACDSFVNITMAFNEAPEPEEGQSEEEATDAAIEFYETRLADDVDTLEANVPEDVDEEVGVLLDGIREYRRTGSSEGFESEEYSEALANANEFFVAECGFETIDVAGIDYAFEGVPETVPTGEAVAFDFTNESEAEFHEMVVFRRNPEAGDQSFEEIFNMDESASEGLLTFTTAAFGAPGDSNTTFANLEPGDYAMVCFIPQGATEENQEGTGPPHFILGMMQEFTVE